MVANTKSRSSANGKALSSMASRKASTSNSSGRLRSLEDDSDKTSDEERLPNGKQPERINQRTSREQRPKASKPARSNAKEQFCVCKGVDDGTPMVYCTNCRDWFHFRCVDLEERDAEDIQLYVCPPCIGRTGQRIIKQWEGMGAIEEYSDVELSEARGSAEVKQEPTSESDGKGVDSAPSDSDSDDGSGDEYVAEVDRKTSKGKGKDSDFGNRRTRRLSLSSGSGLSDKEESDHVRKRKRIKSSSMHETSASPAPGSNIKRRRPSATQTPAKRLKSSPSDANAADDPTRKYCLGKLEETICPIFLEYPHFGGEDGHSDEDAGASERQVGSLTEEERLLVEKNAKEFVAKLEQSVYDTYSEPDKQGNPSAGGKYKERFRMLTFNLGKHDRIVLRKRIASSQITPQELSLMSSTDLANEQTKHSIELAQKESLAHSILQKSIVPRAKITHKGFQDIEDVNDEAARQHAHEQRERQLEDEERRERERMARMRSIQTQALGHGSVPPESPTVPQTPSWGAPPPLPPHTDASSLTDYASQRPPMRSLFVSSESDVMTPVDGELNLADLINIDDDTPPRDDNPLLPSLTTPFGENKSILSESHSEPDPPPTSAVETSSQSTGLSPFAPSTSRPDNQSRSSFDLNALWSGSNSEMPSLERSLTPSPSPTRLEEQKDLGMDVDFLGGEAEDQDFDMFLEKDDDNQGDPNKTAQTEIGPEAEQAAFAALPQVWSGTLNMPLESTMLLGSPVVARQMGGRTLLSEPLMWNTLFPSDAIRIDGRVQTEKSSNYLLTMRMNSSKELIAVALSPSSESDNEKYNNLIDYLVLKDRHGLVFPWGTRPKDHFPGRELYIIPLLSSQPIPDYMELLDELRLPKTRKDHLLIGIWVLNKGKLAPPPHAQPHAPISAALPPAAIATSVSMTTLSPPQIEPAALAAEVASLTPEQIQLMLQTLTSVNPLLAPAAPQPAPVPLPVQALTSRSPSQWPNLIPGGPPAYTGVPHPAPFSHSPPSVPYQQPSYDDFGRGRGGSYGPGHRGRDERGRRGGRGRGRDDDFAHRQPDRGWARNRDRDGPPSPTQGRGHRRWGERPSQW